MIKRLLALAFIGTLAAGSADAQNEYKNLEYVRDPNTELTLTKEDEDRWSIDLRHYGGPLEGRDVYVQGEAKPGLGGHVVEVEYDGRKETVKISTPGKETVSVTTAGVLNTSGTALDLSGEYHQMSTGERLQRAKSRFERADAVLNETYQKIRTEAGKEQTTQLRDRQRDWLKHRDSMAEWEAGPGSDPKSVPAYWDSLLSLTTIRTQFLQLYSGRGIPKGITGEYRDAYGGYLTLKETKGGVEFTMEVVRGPTSHTGEIGGEARIKGNRAYYKENPAEMDDKERKPAELTFTFIDGHIVKIEGKNTQHYHGARAYFDGEYFKEKPAQK